MIENKKIFMAGAGGMLGEAFYEVFSKSNNLKCTDIDLNCDWLSFLDFRDEAEYRKQVQEFSPDYLFHLGAFTNLEYCEQNKEDTYITNALSVENAVNIANDLGIKLLYISTAGIFDGKKELYDDWDTPNPLGVYARSKFMGEKYVCENAKKFFICRAGWMMGGGPQKDKKFIQKIMKQIKDGSSELHIVDDKDGTPTYTIDFANNCNHLLSTNYFGLYNMVCGGQTSRIEVAKELVKILGLESSITIKEVNSEFFSQEYFAERPPNERLINSKLDLRELNLMRDWRVCLKEYLEKSYSEYL